MKNKILRSVFLAIGCASISLFSLGVSSAKNITSNSKSVSTSFLESCKVTKNNAKFFIEATSKDIYLKKGTMLSVVSPDMQQGLIVVKAKQGKRWIRGEIRADETTCAPKLPSE